MKKAGKPIKPEQPPMLDPLSPLNDHVFKRLLGEKDSILLLSDFLKSLLDMPDEEFQGIELVDPRIRGKHHLDKEGVLDVKVITQGGHRIDIEVQVNAQHWIWERLVFYNAGLVMEQVGAGENYDSINRAITILIADFHLTEREGKRYRHRFLLYDPEAKREYRRLFEIHTLELPKLPKSKKGSRLWMWLSFFSARKEEEFEMVTKNDAILSKAWGKLKELSADENERLLAQAREKERRDREIMHKSGLVEGREEGLAKGRVEGLAKGRVEGEEKGLAKGLEEKEREFTLNLLQADLPIELITSYTGLSAERVIEIQKAHAASGNKGKRIRNGHKR